MIWNGPKESNHELIGVVSRACLKELKDTKKNLHKDGRLLVPYSNTTRFEHNTAAYR
jgi:hypothetical protein